MKKILFISFIFSTIAVSQTLIPKLPQITASSFLLIDAETNKIIAQQNQEASTGLASITKIMTSYIVADYLKQGFLNIKDSTTVSEKCWRMEGSRMFIQEGKKVLIEDLMRGMIIQSGNDAACALAEHIAGTQEEFASLMESLWGFLEYLETLVGVSWATWSPSKPNRRQEAPKSGQVDPKKRLEAPKWTLRGAQEPPS